MLAAIKQLEQAGHEVGVGTQSGGYLTVAQHPETGAKLAVRPLFYVSSEGVAFYLRTRIAPAGQGDFAAKQNWHSSYPGIPWSRSDSTRRAVELSVGFRRHPHKDGWMAIHDFLAMDGGGALFDFLADNVPKSHFKIDRATFAKAINESMVEISKTTFKDPQVPSKAELMELLASFEAKVAQLKEALAKPASSVHDLITPLPAPPPPVGSLEAVVSALSQMPKTGGGASTEDDDDDSDEDEDSED